MKKGLKLLLSLATVFMVSGTVTACNVDKRTPEEKVQEAYDSLVYSGLNAVTSDIELITSVADLEDVAITYAVAADQNYLAVAEDGASIKVTRPTYEVGDVMLTPGFTATISYENVTKTKSFNVKIMKASTVITAAEYLQITNDTGDVYSFSGEVVVEGTGAILVGDSTGLVYVYSNDAAEKADVGDFVRIEGGFTAYNAVPQFAYNAKTPCSTTKLNDSEVVDSYRYSKPESATAWDAERLDSYVNKENPTVTDLQGHYITFEGILSVSGKYYNVEFPGASKAVGSIAYPSEALKTELDALDGKMISATGYTLYISGGKYVNLFAESVKEVTVDDNKKAELATNNLKVAKEVEEDFVLPATSTYGAEVTWTSNNEALAVGAKTENGYPVTVTRANSDVEVTLTATVKVGEVTKVRDFTVTVLAIPQYVDVVETTPTPGVDYKFGFELPQGTYFFNGGMDESGKYGNTTDLSEGYVTVQVEEVNEKYRLFFMDGEAKKYIEMKEVDENGTMKQRFRIVDEPVATYDWDSTFNTFTVELSGTKYYMGTYSSGGKDPFSTISVSAYSYLEKNTSTQYPAHLFKKVLASEVPTVVTSIKDALKAAEGTQVSLEGTVTEIYYEWSDKFNNMSFYIADEAGNSILAFRTGTKVEVGNKVRVEGTITYYNEVAQIAEGCTTTVLESGSEDGGETDVITTIAEALKAAEGAKVSLEGTVTEIYYEWSDKFNNMSFYIADEAGNSILAFRTGTKVEVGNKVRVEGTITYYNEVAQIAEGCTTTVLESGSEDGGETDVITTILEAMEAKEGNQVCIEGRVSGIYEAWSSHGNMSFYIADEYGNEILIFRASKEVTMNDIVKVEGTITIYQNKAQVAQGATVTILEEGVYDDPTANLTDGAKASMNFEATNRTEYSTEKQVWSSNGITVTGTKGASTSNVGDYTNPARFYKSTTLTIEYTEAITKIVLETSGDRNFAEGTELEGATVTIVENYAVIELETAATSFTIASMPTQVRVANLYVFTA